MSLPASTPVPRVVRDYRQFDQSPLPQQFQGGSPAVMAQAGKSLRFHFIGYFKITLFGIMFELETNLSSLIITCKPHERIDQFIISYV